MWWSPDGSKLAFYRFDESKVPDYYLQLDQTKLYSTMDIEAYPKAGDANPVVDLYVYDVATKQDARSSTSATASRSRTTWSATTSTTLRWSPDGRELTFNRTNRRQNIMEFTACDPATGKCRVDRARGVAGELGRELADDALPEGRQALHLGVGAHRLPQLLPVRSDRQAARDADAAIRSRSANIVHVDEASQRALLHGAQRRQPHEAAAAPRGPGRQGRSAADRSEAQSHASTSRRTASTSSTSRRRTTRRRSRG